MSDEEAFAIVNKRLAESDKITVDLLNETFKHYSNKFEAHIDYIDGIVYIKVKIRPV